MKKRLISRALALIMALSLLSTTAFAASFTDLQDAIDGVRADENDKYANGTVFTKENDETQYYGYGWNSGESRWGVEAWDTTGDDGSSTRNVLLNEDVLFDRDGADRNGATNDKYTSGIVIVGKTSPDSVVIDLNGKTIDLNPGASLDAEDGKFYAVDEDGNRTDQVVAGKALNDGAVFEIRDGANVTINDSTTKTVKDENGEIHYVAGSGTGTITGGNRAFDGGIWWSQGAGVSVSNSSLVMNGGIVTGNKEIGQHGGGVFICANGKKTSAELNGVVVSNNRAELHSGGVHIANNATVTIQDSIISNNCSGGAHGIYCSSAGENYTSINNAVCNNTTHYEAGILGFFGQETVVGYPDKSSWDNRHVWGETTVVTAATCMSEGTGHHVCKSGCEEDCVLAIDPDNHAGEVRTETTPAQIGVEGETRYYCADCDALIRTEVIPALPAGGGNNDDGGDDNGNDDENVTTPDISGADTSFTAPASDAATTIEDDEIPLAGLLTLADLLEALREHEEIPEIELPEDFKWIDHELAQAIYWGLQEELVVDTEEDSLDPDEVLTVGLMREVLTNFVEIYVGLEDFEVVLDGEDEDLVMDYIDMIARLGVFYEDLEAALEAEAA